MPFWVYILECLDRAGNATYYTGYTNNIGRRVHEHRTGRGARYTKGKRLELKYCEEHTTQRDAMRREIAIKRLPRGKKIQLVHLFLREGMQHGIMIKPFLRLKKGQLVQLLRMPSGGN